MSILSDRLTEALARSGMKQRQLADKVGVTEVSMSRYIKGTRTPKGPMVAKLAKALNVTSDYLLGREPETDSDVAGNCTFQLIEKHVDSWSKEQRLDLCNLLFK